MASFLSSMRSNLLKSHQRLNFCEIMKEAVDFRLPPAENDEKLFAAYATAAKKFDVIAFLLSNLCRDHLQSQFIAPKALAVGAETAAAEYQQTAITLESHLDQAIGQLKTSLEKSLLGRIEWTDDESCVCTFFETNKIPGIFKHTFNHQLLTHHMVGAKAHRLPAACVKKTARADQIIKAIPATLHDYVRIVTGTLVVNQAAYSHSTEVDTAFSKLLKAGGTAATAVGVAALGAIGTVSSMLATASPIAVADPAIVIGELCFYGWE